MNNVDMIQKFMEFRKGFTGDPKAEVMKLVQSGKITQAQLNQIQAQAEQFQKILGGM